MDKLKELGYDVTYSGVSPIASWGKYMIHARKSSDGAMVSGYGDDEAAAIAYAVNTVSNRSK